VPFRRHNWTRKQIHITIRDFLLSSRGSNLRPSNMKTTIRQKDTILIQFADTPFLKIILLISLDHYQLTFYVWNFWLKFWLNSELNVFTFFKHQCRWLFTKWSPTNSTLRRHRKALEKFRPKIFVTFSLFLPFAVWQ
jgi:hypothetical protein